MWGRKSKQIEPPNFQDVNRPCSPTIERWRRFGLLAGLTMAAIILTAFAEDRGLDDIFRPFRDASGLLRSLPNNSLLDQTNAFFDPGVGTAGQACATCHQPNQGFSIAVADINWAFLATNGLDPLFRPNDTADRPDANITNQPDATGEERSRQVPAGVLTHQRYGEKKCRKGNSDVGIPSP